MEITDSNFVILQDNGEPLIFDDGMLVIYGGFEDAEMDAREGDSIITLESYLNLINMDSSIYSYGNLQDLFCLKKKAEDMTCTEFVEWVKANCDYREVAPNLIDFDYRSLTGSICAYNNCLCRTYDCYDESDSWAGTLMCETINFKSTK